MPSADCPACLATARDPALDMDGNAWCAHHAARVLADVAKLLALPPSDQSSLALVLAYTPARYLAGLLERNGGVSLPFEPTPGELDRLSEPT